MSDIEEDVKILNNLKRYLNILIYEGQHKIFYNDLGYDEKTIDCINALEHILAERKQDKERIQKLEEEKKTMCEEYCPKTERIKELEEENQMFKDNKVLVSRYFRLKDNSIPKQKIKNLIKNKTINISGFECIAVEDLEELLEDK